MNNLSIRLTFADDILDLAPQMRFVRHRLLQTARSLMIDAFLAERIPGDLGLVQSKRRQHVQQVQLSLILLRYQESQRQSEFGVIREVLSDQHALQGDLAFAVIHPFALIIVKHQHRTRRGTANRFRY